MKKILKFAAIGLLCAGCTNTAKVENVIFLIGDGMGIGAVSTLIQGSDENCFTIGDPVIGFSETSTVDKYVTDSPAGGTALATGAKTKYGYCGMGSEGEDLTSSLNVAKSLGKKTGIVVNTILTEATPAAFYACAQSRREQYLIAQQFTECDVDVAIGGGLDPFINRPDSIDLTGVLIDKGYDVYLDWTSTINTKSEKYVSILPDSNIHRRAEQQGEAKMDERNEVCVAASLAAAKANEGEIIPLDPREYLPKAVEKALSSLSVNAPKGYFLMIESAIIDGYEHNNYSEGLVDEMNEFNQTLTFLVNYVNEHPNTLLVVTADHETGDTGIGYGNKGEDPISHIFGTTGHTGNVVPVFAYGAGKENFGGVQLNSDITPKINALMSK